MQIVHESAEFFNKLADRFERILADDPSEEKIQMFFKENPAILGFPNNRSRIDSEVVEGQISRFPVSVDRIPDFLISTLVLKPCQEFSRLSFIELKRPGAPLYVQHARMSRELNDAWIECTETMRLLASNYQDVLRRLIKQLAEMRLHDLEQQFQTASLDPQDPRKPNAAEDWNDWLPICTCYILIGRRSTLDREAMLRTRTLTLSTHGGIEVLTYDYVLKELREAAARGSTRWLW